MMVEGGDVSRRSFLANSVLASGSLLMGPRAWSWPGEPQMRFGLVTYLWGRDWNLDTLITNCEATDVLGVELRTTHAHGVEPDLDARQRIEIKKRLADTPVEIVGIGSNEQFDHLDAARLKKAIDAGKAFLQLSHDVGGTGVKVKPNRFHRKVPREKTIEQIGESLNELARFGAELGQEIRLEVHGSGTQELPVIEAIMKVADHPGVGVCWNSNSQDLDGKGLEHNFKLVEKRFGRTLHVRELDMGSYPYARLMELLVGMDYRGWVLLEARSAPKDRVEALKAQRLVWEKMIASARKKSKATKRG